MKLAGVNLPVKRCFHCHALAMLEVHVDACKIVSPYVCVTSGGEDNDGERLCPVHCELWWSTTSLLARGIVSTTAGSVSCSHKNLVFTVMHCTKAVEWLST